MKYTEIYSQFYLKMTDTGLFKQPKEDVYDQMCGWMRSVAALPHVRKCFSDINFNDELNELTFELADSVDKDSDEDFVKELFAQGMVIGWLRPQVNSIYNTAQVFGTKEEKPIQNNYKANKEHLTRLEKDFKKFIRDYRYLNSKVLGEL